MEPSTPAPTVDPFRANEIVKLINGETYAMHGPFQYPLPKGGEPSIEESAMVFLIERDKLGLLLPNDATRMLQRYALLVFLASVGFTDIGLTLVDFSAFDECSVQAKFLVGIECN